MTNKKNAFFTFCFSLIPGAGEMYLGFYRMGGSIMFFTMVTLALSESLFPPMGYLLPIFWFYSLFHTHNLNHLPDEEFYAVEDAYLFHLQPDALLRGDWLQQYRRPTAALLVIFGAAIAWNAVWNVIRTFLFQFAVSDAVIEMVYVIGRAVPQLAAAACIVWMGLLLIRRKKEELIPAPPYLEDRQAAGRPDATDSPSD